MLPVNAIYSFMRNFANSHFTVNVTICCIITFCDVSNPSGIPLTKTNCNQQDLFDSVHKNRQVGLICFFFGVIFPFLLSFFNSFSVCFLSFMFPSQFLSLLVGFVLQVEVQPNLLAFLREKVTYKSRSVKRMKCGVQIADIL